MKVFGQYWFLQVLTCWAVLDGVYGSCSGDDDCKNSGTCVSTTCVCDGTGYNGDSCENDINECDAGTDDCHTNADCKNTEGSFTCTCKPNYAGNGKSCTLGVCSTGGNECLNSGICNIPSDSTASTCQCAAGYTGGLCETDIDECATDADDCDTNADCTNAEGSFTCTCKHGYAGVGKTCIEGVCSEDGDECLNGGTCDTSSSPTKCSCADGFIGDTCQNGGGTMKISAYLLGMTVFSFFLIL
ncbi:neurogenic locus notch homolog protein 1-like isoform X2 [Haliotis rubra]|uniref:neurogenic locus notch homolog protein 1-like isoform X2 n=1 Tax=Haliotis rubra TaxID=36100 RepID=UPI001EE4FE5B|nr:neurogenic locus notch homolog protein 1-like isoform X2 [Haliotis rubra]